MKKILFLGYNSKETRLIEKLKNYKNFHVFNTKKEIKPKDVNNINLIICFGYRYIINERVIKTPTAASDPAWSPPKR